MTTSTNSKRRLAGLAASVAAMAFLVPVARAQSPDAFMRAVDAQQQTQIRTPDVFVRAVNARPSDKFAAIDARERGLTERPAVQPSPGPDAFERALITHADALTAQTVAMLDARERSLASRPLGSVQQPVPASGFDWSDFGIGAGAGLLLALVAGVAAFVVGRSYGRLKTA